MDLGFDNMILSRRSFLAATAATLNALPARARNVAAPQPYGILPSARQWHWSEMEIYNFLHFTINTFTDKEWGYGDESPALFNPTAFDADAIVSTLKDFGSKGVILTCKHHDGFCLWPTKTSERSVKNSPFRKGNGDVVKEVSAAAQRHGLKFGVYVSPWDRSQPSYGHPQYITIYRQQIRELLTGYGPIFEIWHDGANGGDGFYGGAREKRVIDKLHYYDWDNTWKMERELQPAAVLFSDVGPDIRWVGNEKGIAGDPCWATYTPVALDGGSPSPGNVKESEAVTGTRNGKFWMPAECDVSIRPGWFWHEAENTKVKTSRELLALYYDSVGRGASFLLNVPPDRRGLIHERDAASLRAFGELIRRIFSHNLARQAGSVVASNVRANDAAFSPKLVLDQNPDTYWSADDGITTAEIVFHFPRSVTFNIARIGENTRLGQRIAGCAVDAWTDGDWRPFAASTSVGHCRILHSPRAIRTTRVRLRITESAACPAVSEFGLFLEN
ncbi:MAG TPA: alpha-L-fucosidase [Bryobacteraceae bacterium]|jgi:alpha-L-fucosidase|nr:alpha-L-fucosidase [Bryobacteraceae bacterium]